MCEKSEGSCGVLFHLACQQIRHNPKWGYLVCGGYKKVILNLPGFVLYFIEPYIKGLTHCARLLFIPERYLLAMS